MAKEINPRYSRAEIKAAIRNLVKKGLVVIDRDMKGRTVYSVAEPAPPEVTDSAAKFCRGRVSLLQIEPDKGGELSLFPLSSRNRATGCVRPDVLGVKSRAAGGSRTNSFQIRQATTEAFEPRIFRVDARNVGREGRTPSGHVAGH
jgi:hypothetical protein